MDRRFRVLRIISFVLAVIGFALAVFMTFVTPTQIITTSDVAVDGRAETIIVNTSNNIVPLLIVLGAVMFLAIGVGIGFALREYRFDETEKLKNNDVDKKKKRIAAPEYAQTNDGERLEVVDFEDTGKVAGR